MLADGSAVISGVTEASDTATVVTFSDTTKSTLADDTFVTLGFVATKEPQLTLLDFTSTDKKWEHHRQTFQQQILNYVL